MNLNKQKLELMFQELRLAPKIYSPSSFWENLNNHHISELANQDVKSFKRTVNMRYFNWGILGILRHQLSPIISEILSGNLEPLLNSKFINHPKNQGNKEFNSLGKFVYRVYVASLYEYVARIDSLGLLGEIEEPRLGDPYIVEYKGKRVSQDLCNSIYEFYTMYEHMELNKNASIAELGAGYGRVGYVFLKAFPNASYCIIDIPPALYIAQEYLSTLFSKDKIFSFRHFDKFSNVSNEFKAARIKFLTPNQIEQLPNNIFDLIINISSLHEMQRDQIKNYLKQIDRLDKGYFYTKQWRRSRVKDNLFISENEYSIPRRWKKIFKRVHPIQKMFFDALYKLKNT